MKFKFQKVAIVSLLALGISGSVLADEGGAAITKGDKALTGQMILDNCTKMVLLAQGRQASYTDSVEIGQCLGFMSATIESVIYFSQMGVFSEVCMKEDQDYSDIMLDLIEYFKMQTPKQLERSALVLSFESLKQTNGCKD